ncbi:hypothetical protein ACFLRY_04335 [Bacteroidota bacterium]
MRLENKAKVVDKAKGKSKKAKVRDLQTAYQIVNNETIEQYNNIFS